MKESLHTAVVVKCRCFSCCHRWSIIIIIILQLLYYFYECCCCDLLQHTRTSILWNFPKWWRKSRNGWVEEGFLRNITKFPLASLGLKKVLL